MLAETDNRRILETFRLLVDPRDSLGWASLLLLTPGIGQTFSDYIYEQARARRIQFGQALFDAEAANFPSGPRTAAVARELMQSVTGWLNDHPVLGERPENGWALDDRSKRW